jgi:hypothetical protein
MKIRRKSGESKLSDAKKKKSGVRAVFGGQASERKNRRRAKQLLIEKTCMERIWSLYLYLPK